MNLKIDAHLLRYYQRVSRLLESLGPDSQPRTIPSPRSARPGDKIIVFPGSFNPPTLAHLALLKQAHLFAHQQTGRWQIYAALSRYIVDKEVVERMTLLDRVVLLENVLKDEIKHAGILLLNRGLYVEQAQAIRESFPQVRKLYFLMGFDKIVQIFDARYYSDRDSALHALFRLAHLLVAPRGTNSENELQLLLNQPENKPFARYIHPLPLARQYQAISSTQIRQAQNPDTSTLPERVRDFITRTKPYTAPVSKQNGTISDPYAERTRALQSLLSE